MLLGGMFIAVTNKRTAKLHHVGSFYIRFKCFNINVID